MGFRNFLAGIVLVAVIVSLIFHYRTQLSGQLIEIENWIAGLGVWGPLVFLALFVVLTSFFFPDSLISAVAGALFGTLAGIAVVVVGALVAQSIAFCLSRHLFQGWVQKAIEKRPKLAAIQQAADREGFRLQFLVRLLPLNPVIVSHVIGTTKTRFGVFLLACLGIVPGLFVQVYCGSAAKHLIKAVGQPSEHLTFHTLLLVAGLIACLVLLMMVIRMARRAISEIED